MADDHWSDRLVVGNLLSSVLVDILRLVAVISGIVLVAAPAQAMSDAALLGAYCASFWQSIVDDSHTRIAIVAAEGLTRWNHRGPVRAEARSGL